MLNVTDLNRMPRFHPKVTAYYYKDWSNFNMDFHAHDSMEIMYVISGECLVEVGNKQHRMKKNQFILINTGIRHRLIVEKTSCRMLNVEYKFVERHRNFPSLFELANESEELQELLIAEYTYHLSKDTNDILHTLRNLVLELDTDFDNKNDNYLMVHILITQLLLLISRNLVQAKTHSNQVADIYVKEVVQYLHENYDYDIKVKELSELTHLHINYLHRIFKESMGCTIVEYLTKVRVEKAKQLISQTTIPITDISSFIGMNSSQYFSKIFKRHTGVTPTEYRKKHCDTLKVLEAYK